MVLKVALRGKFSGREDEDAEEEDLELGDLIVYHRGVGPANTPFPISNTLRRSIGRTRETS